MLFLGAFLGADYLSMPFTPTPIIDNDVLELTGAKVDTLYVTKDIERPIDFTIPTEWDFDTIMYAEFDDNAEGGNIDWTLATVSQLIIRRRPVGEYDWMTLMVKDVETVEDFEFHGFDITTESLEYEYAVFPALNGAEGVYASAIVDAKNTHLVIADEDAVYKTIITDGYCETVDQAPNSPIVTLYDRYPTIIRNTNAQYEEISVTATFLPVDDEGECIDYEEVITNDRLRVLYNRKFKDWLANGKTKILKNVDGQTWLVYVTTPATDNADTVYYDRTLTFTCTEIGNMKSEEDLYEAGLSDVPEEYWYSR